MFTRRLAVVVCGAMVGLAATVSATSMTSLESRKTSQLTFSGPVRLPGVTLPAGTYVFELATPGTDQEVVVVRDQKRTHLYLMAFTRQVPRPDGLSDNRQVVMGESPKGTPPPIVAWYPTGHQLGHRFLYNN